MRAQSIGLIFLLAVAACSGGTSSGNAGASAAPSETAMAVASNPVAPESLGSPVAAPTPTADSNLLSVSNGTILRSYSPASLDHIGDGNLGNVAEGFGTEISPDSKPPFVFTFELPGATAIASFSAALRSENSGAPAANADFAVSTTGPDAGFKDVGTITRNPNGPTAALAVNVQARWVRVTANQPFDSVSALGTLAPAPAHLDPTGTYVVQAVPEANGSFVMGGTQAGLDGARFVATGAGLTGTTCTADVPIAPYAGQLAGRTWDAKFAGNKDANPDTIHAVVNDDASIIAGVSGERSIVFMRTTKPLHGCLVRTNGTGAHHVLVLDQDPIPSLYPTDASPPIAGYRFDAIGAGMIDAATVATYDTIVARGVCKLTDLVGPQQLALLLQWAAARGHKLILTGAGCETGADFTWLPYAFTTGGPGPESTNASLIQVEDDALGTNDKNDATHFVDTGAYVANANSALSATRPVTTSDTHWCGHFFVAKTTNLNGFVQVYANDASGFLLYDGFSSSDDGNPQLQKIRGLELALPVPSDLPCTQRATDAFLLEPSQEMTYKAGMPQTITVHFDLLANQGWNGHVTTSAQGPFKTTVGPASFDIAGGVVHLDAVTQIAASAKPGLSTVVITADGANGKRAQATLTLTGLAPLRKAAILPHQTIRLYGIHFDYDSAHIQPRSEPVIADVAALMRANPSWRFEISGHTDSDGGAAYNLALSQRRAQAVVDDLVTRYGIARSRMVAKGYGLTRPVASNATDAGKALNRRVELERLQ
jgi:outer membrane protein OmpA-like peptidoglycan-associated protein